MSKDTTNVEDAYNQWATTYDTNENRTRDLDATVTRNLLADLRCNVLVEIGCGTGKNTIFLAQRAKAVHALDFSAEMLAKAKARVSAENVQFQQADLTQNWPVDSDSAELIVCNLVLEHIEDLDHIFAEAARVLTDFGRFHICELHPFWQYQGAKANFEQNGVKTVVDAFIHNISDFLSAATANEFALLDLNEWWHETDEGKPPRLITFMFERTA